MTVTGGSDAPGIGPGCDGTASGTLTLDWTNPTDFIYSNTYSMPSITFVKDFLLSGTDTKATIDNIGDHKIVPYIADAMTLTDGESYTATSNFAINSATYRKTLDEGRVGKHQPWLVPFDYTITAADLEKFKFWKINMIANAPNPKTMATDQMWVFLKPLGEGDVLHANMPYVYMAKTAVTDYEFTTQNALMKAMETGVTVKTETTEDVYSFYATYGPTTATANDPFYYVNIDGQLSLGDNVTVGAFRWIIRVKSKFSDTVPAYARRMVFFDDDETTGIVSLDDSATTVNGRDAWYTLDGRKLDGKPGQRGIYVNNGKKVVIKK